MRSERTGRGHEVREITTLTHCSGCGQPFRRPHFSLSWANYSCTPGHHGHRIGCCMRGNCRVQTFDPPCTAEGKHHPLGGHDHTPASWDDVQHGPTLDLGE